MFPEPSTVSDSPDILYPWHQSCWRRFRQQVVNDKRPHALMLSGQRGIGKSDFARLLAHSVLCIDSGDGFPCGHCRSCQLNQAHTHPDLLLIAPEKPGGFIRIDQVRQLNEFVNKTSQQGHAKVVVLEPLEALNLHASNALLKTLEEPAGDTLLLLITHMPSTVIATIRSRCQILAMTAPNRQQFTEWLTGLQLDRDSVGRAQQWLNLAAGSPLMAKSMAMSDYSSQVNSFIAGLETLQREHSSIKVAAQWLDIELPDILSWWLQVIYLLTKRRFIDSDVTDQTASDDILKPLYSCYGHYALDGLFGFSDRLLQLKQQLHTGANVNKQLLLEELLLDWYRLERTR